MFHTPKTIVLLSVGMLSLIIPPLTLSPPPPQKKKKHQKINNNKKTKTKTNTKTSPTTKIPKHQQQQTKQKKKTKKFTIQTSQKQRTPINSLNQGKNVAFNDTLIACIVTYSTSIAREEVVNWRYFARIPRVPRADYSL